MTQAKSRKKPRTRARREVPALPPWPGLLAPVAVSAFADLGVSVGLWMGTPTWLMIHEVRSVAAFEDEHGEGPARWDYNGRCFAEVTRTQQPVLGAYAGFHDLFVPILDGGVVRGILICGPFAVSRPKASEVLERWRSFAGKRGRVGDPEFRDYLAATLGTLTLRGRSLRAFQRLVSSFAGLVNNLENSEALYAEIQRSRAELAEIRIDERLWEATRNMIDERTRRTWTSFRESVLADLGMQRLPEHVVVGLLRSKGENEEPIDDLIRRDAVQRACAGLAHELGGIASGPIGDHGVVFLVDHSGPKSRTRATLTALASEAVSLARRHRLQLAIGIKQGDGTSTPLSKRYQAALWLAEEALARGVWVVYDEPELRARHDDLRRLRATIGGSIRERSTLLSPRFERYIEAVLAHVGYRFERTRAELDAGLERLTEPLLANGFLSEKSYADLFADLEASADNARTVNELVAVYRQHVTEVQAAVVDPTAAQQERGTRLAVAFLREHFAEPLQIRQVARIAGFAPDHFCRLFKRDEGLTPELYLQRLRLEHARQMLVTTELSVDTVGKFCGFRARNYFHRVFKGALGMTPTEYRKRAPANVGLERSDPEAVATRRGTVLVRRR